MLLVDDGETQALEVQIVLEQAMRAYHDVNFAFLDFLHQSRIGRRCLEPGEDLNPHRIVSESLAKDVVMLVGQ